jgi:KipI family sensor histidine kinase inhibitor
MPSPPEPRFLPAADSALIVEFGDRLDTHVSALVLALAHKLAAARPAGVLEAVPTFRSLMVHYDPLQASHADLRHAIQRLLPGLAAAPFAGRRWRIPACYEASLGVDLADVARRTGLSPGQVVERHSQTSQLVCMMGFLPGLPYLAGLPGEFRLPRRENPRVRVPSGSVAVAMAMSVIYPQESPGGWHILARTPMPLWDLRRSPPALLAAGDQVTFQPLSLREYELMLAEAAAAELDLTRQAPPAPGQRA